ncbi:MULTISPECIES: ribonuclease M5 [Vagococcus]|uniref:Ribonuclease M5 n=1 Tax=Vagococcus fluvialis bH819 TaxID=1255619 RepID=A0A1X6WMT1_9ENTE|nr:MULTISPECIES: ribonuclease M5 [Vagococcus]SLM85590.1 Ribonuclease M5 [Vagococcus fluvialis bH819]HCM89559.1 ribonuclease M5 [Vagococcus sp.]
MTKKIRIEEIIVVEGKSDTKRVQQVVEADTIETNGSALSEETLLKIEHAEKVRGVIVFTDPDFSGEKIRKQITEVVPTAKHAFISRKKGEPQKKGNSLGVEHASDETIIEALRNVSTPTTDSFDSEIENEDLIRFGLIAGPHAKGRRESLGEKLNIGYTNGKQLKKRLKMFHIEKEIFTKAMKEILEGEKNE